MLFHSFRSNRSLFPILVILSAFFHSSIASALTVSLKEAINSGLQNNRQILSQETQEKQAATDVMLARGEFGPKVGGFAGTGPINEVSGNALTSASNNSKWGILFLGDLEFTVPIYTWGRKRNYVEAAKAGIEVKKYASKGAREKLRLEIKEAYWGALLMLSLKDFVADGKKDLRTALEKTKNKLDRYRLEIFLAEIQSKEAELEKSLKLALAGLSLRMGLPRDTKVLPKESWIETGERKLKKLEFYLSKSRDNRIEFKQLEAGIFAKNNLAKAEHKSTYPMFAVAAKYSFAYSNVRERQQSEFAYDPYNRDSLAAGFGVQWDFNWGVQHAKESKYRAEAAELELKLEYARQGIPVDVKRAYWDVQESEIKLEVSNSARRAAKKWLAKTSIGAATGLGGAKALVEAYGARAKTIKDYYLAIYNHHMAWARLSLASGVEVDPIF